ncbi:MAG: hypothetical protein KDG89_18475 [Geminicoccaceae bacterium]|nr:hypothetical protein [Geminicoccaceae bacterium]
MAARTRARGVEVVAEPKDQKGLAALPGRWVVGPTWGWRRRSNKHVARSLASATPSLSPPSRSGALQGAERTHPLFGSALSDLRHSLDPTVDAAALKPGAGRPDSCFPVARDAGARDEVVRRKCRGVPADPIPPLGAFKPCGGGDDRLHATSRMSGPNERRVVLKPDLDVSEVRFNARPSQPLSTVSTKR